MYALLWLQCFLTPTLSEFDGEKNSSPTACNLAYKSFLNLDHYSGPAHGPKIWGGSSKRPPPGPWGPMYHITGRYIKLIIFLLLGVPSTFWRFSFQLINSAVIWKVKNIGVAAATPATPVPPALIHNENATVGISKVALCSIVEHGKSKQCFSTWGR